MDYLPDVILAIVAGFLVGFILMTFTGDLSDKAPETGSIYIAPNACKIAE